MPRMTEAETSELLAAVRELIEPHLKRSEPLRRVARLIGQMLIEESRRAQEPSAAPGDAAPASGHPAPAHPRAGAPRADSAPAGSDPDPVAAVVPLSLGEATVAVPVQGTPDEITQARVAVQTEPDRAPHQQTGGHEATDTSEVDLDIVEQRCRLKAESCRLFIDRRAAEGDPIAERPLVDRVDALLERARALPDCFLWVLFRERGQPDDSTLRAIGRCYDALAGAAGLAHRIEEIGDRVRDDHLLDVMQLLAEASSALRVALEATWLTLPDIDQDQVHEWIRREGSRRQIYVPRFMRNDDPADPADAEGVMRQADELGAEIDEHAARMKEIEEAFKTVGYHLRRIDQSEEREPHDVQRIAEAVSTLLDLGVPPTDRRFRRAFDAQTAASFPDDVPAPLASVLQRVVEWHEARAAAEPEPVAQSPREWSEQVRQVRELLHGRAVVIVGGEPRNEAKNRIREAFDLAEITWVRLTEHGTGKPMQAPISREDTALVLVLVKLVGTLHADEAMTYARAAGNPFVLLKAGYNPEQIAESVLRQASDQLALLDQHFGA